MLRWWPQVDARSLRADALAGLTGAIILVPQAVAYAGIAGLPPQYGLYTAIVPVIVAALFGSSMHLVSGPTAALSLVIFATISPIAEPGSAAYIQHVVTLSFMTGVLMLAMGLARLGFIVNFISHTVVIGFTAGAAVLIAASQLKNLFGLKTPATSSFVETLAGFARELGHTNPWVLAVGAVSLLAGLLTRRHLPQVPYMISAMLVGSLFAAALQSLLGRDPGITTVGAIPRSLPPLSMPDLSAQSLRELGAVAVALTMLSLTEAIAIARAIALKSGQRIDGSQEFIGQGLANIVGAFCSAMPCSGSFNRSGVNAEAGARTPMAAASAAVWLLLLLLLLAPLARHLPLAVVGALLLVVALGLFDWREMRRLWRDVPADRVPLVVTLVATVTLSLEWAILLGVTSALLAQQWAARRR